MLTRDGHGSGLDRLIDEPHTVGLRAGERKKQVAPFHGAAVHGEAGNRNGFRPRIDCYVIAEQFAKSHRFPASATPLTAPEQNILYAALTDSLWMSQE
jgi:hypothetical protein